jgi:hypothetical protein
MKCAWLVYDVDEVWNLCNVWYTSIWLSKSNEQVISSVFLESITKCDKYCPNFRKTPRLEKNIICPARCLCHANSSPDKTPLICVAHDNWKIHPKTNSCNYVSVRCQVLFDSECLLQLQGKRVCSSTVEKMIVVSLFCTGIVIVLHTYCVTGTVHQIRCCWLEQEKWENHSYFLQVKEE